MHRDDTASARPASTFTWSSGGLCHRAPGPRTSSAAGWSRSAAWSKRGRAPASPPMPPISLLGAAAAHVSRGASKLIAALDHFRFLRRAASSLSISARRPAASREVLLERGAARVYAVDVGHGQLHARLAADPRVVSLEDCDARRLDRTLVPEPVGALVADVSFISLTKALPVPLTLTRPGAWLVALIKPQFEAGRAAVGKRGIVRDRGGAAAGRGRWCATGSPGSRTGACSTSSPRRSPAARATRSSCWERRVAVKAQEVEIDGLGAQGDGVVELPEELLYIPYALPGELWRFVDGEPPVLLRPHPARAEPVCRHFGSCGGCDAQHMPDGLYAAWKRAIVVEAFRHRGTRRARRRPVPRAARQPPPHPGLCPALPQEPPPRLLSRRHARHHERHRVPHRHSRSWWPRCRRCGRCWSRCSRARPRPPSTCSPRRPASTCSMGFIHLDSPHKHYPRLAALGGAARLGPPDGRA